MNHYPGVYFEKLLKGSDISLWMRNIHLAAYGVVVGLVGVWVNDGVMVSEKGFFFGYNGKSFSLFNLQSIPQASFL